MQYGHRKQLMLLGVLKMFTKQHFEALAEFIKESQLENKKAFAENPIPIDVNGLLNVEFHVLKDSQNQANMYIG
jgi:hypothetical protein